MLKSDGHGPLSNFAFNFDVRRYSLFGRNFNRKGSVQYDEKGGGTQYERRGGAPVINIGSGRV